MVADAPVNVHREADRSRVCVVAETDLTFRYAAGEPPKIGIHCSPLCMTATDSPGGRTKLVVDPDPPTLKVSVLDRVTIAGSALDRQEIQ